MQEGESTGMPTQQETRGMAWASEGHQPTGERWDTNARSTVTLMDRHPLKDTLKDAADS